MNNKLVNREGITKLSLSLALLLYAIIVACITRNYLLFFAMLFSSIGDAYIMNNRGVFLKVKRRETFCLGALSFGMAHLLYIGAMEAKHKSIIFVATIFIFAMQIIILASKSKPKIEKMYFIPYALLIFLNTFNAWNYSTIAGIGMIFFIMSDGILALFEEKSPKWQIPIWVTYVLAQILLITSVLINR